MSMSTFNLEWTVRPPGRRSLMIPLLAKPYAKKLRSKISHECIIEECPKLLKGPVHEQTLR